MPNRRLSRLVRGAAIAAVAMSVTTVAAFAQDVADVPRNQTLVLTPWGDQPAQFSNIDNWNPYLTPTVTHQRDAMEFTVNEELFYTNLNTGKLIPWQAESYEIHARLHDRDHPPAQGRGMERRTAFHVRRRQVHT